MLEAQASHITYVRGGATRAHRGGATVEYSGIGQCACTVGLGNVPVQGRGGE